MADDSLIIKPILQIGPEYKALMRSSTQELLANRLYTQAEVDAMHTTGEFRASWMPWHHYVSVGIYGADVGGRVIGCIELLERDDRTGILEVLYVEKPFRDKHVATRLIHEAAKEAQARHVEAIEVHTMVREPKALAFWTKFFKPISPNDPGYVMILGGVGKRSEAIGWRLAPDRFPGLGTPASG